MSTQPEFSLKDLLTHIVADIVKAVSDRPGETPQQQFTRSLAVTHTILAFQPRDAIEAMLAGHCVLLHELIVDGVRDATGAATDTARRAARANLVAMDRAFGNNLTRLERYRKHHAAASPEANPADMPTRAADHPEEAAARTPPLNRQARRQMKRQARKAAAVRPTVTPTRTAPAAKASATTAD